MTMYGVVQRGLCGAACYAVRYMLWTGAGGCARHAGPVAATTRDATLTASSPSKAMRWCELALRYAVR
eukprot:5156289-Pleurochrysis_carterae.AAC.4